MNYDITTCAIVAASDFNAADFKSRLAGGALDFVVAVDGGFAHLSVAGVVPDLAIGDFDSLGFVPEGGEVLTFPSHKDKSDLELAFDETVGRGFEAAIVYGALGGRLDHTIANLQMCSRFAEQGTKVKLVGVDCVVDILAGSGVLELPARESGTVSVFSATNESHGVSIRGLEYPLENATLTNRTTLGLSNEFIALPAVVSVEEGTLLVFHPACSE